MHRLGDPLDRREAVVPPGGDLCHLSLGLSEPFVADAEARFKAGASGLYEIGAFEDEEVLGDALSRDRQFGGERAGRRFAALKQQVQQPQPHRVTGRRPQAIGVLAVARHRAAWKPVARAV